MPARNTWEDRAANLLKAELKRKGIKYAELIQRLDDIGVSENERNLRNKISRGKFTASFLLQCLEAAEVTDLRIS